MKPLSKKTRRISWALLFLIFVAISPFILSYSFGYRFDDEGIVKTGGIYVHSDVSDTEVFVDGEYIKNNGVWMRNVLVQTLNPDVVHSVEMHKDGYHSWTKKLSVAEGMVTEAYALMLPTSIKTMATYPAVDAQGNGTTTLGLVNKAPQKTYTVIESLFAVSDVAQSASTTPSDILDALALHGVNDVSDLVNFEIVGDQAAWLEDGNVIVTWANEQETTPFYFCTVTNCRDQIVLDWDTDIVRFAFMPERSDVLLVLNNEGLWAVEIDDRSERNIQPVYLGASLDFRINENDRIVVSDSGVFFELRI